MRLAGRLETASDSRSMDQYQMEAWPSLQLTSQAGSVKGAARFTAIAMKPARCLVGTCVASTGR